MLTSHTILADSNRSPDFSKFPKKSQRVKRTRGESKEDQKIDASSPGLYSFTDVVLSRGGTHN